VTPEFSALLERQLDAVKEGSAAAWAALQRMGEQQRAGAYRVLACSDFVARAVTARQTLLPQLLNEGALATSRSLEDYQVLAEAVAGAAQGDETAFTAGIRQWREREMVRIAWRDLAGDATVEQTLLEASWFAEAAIGIATRFAAQLLARRHGSPAGADAGLIVLGMGKLGGRELNFSSDIDLIFLYAESGETDGPHPISCEEFYLRQGRTLIRLLDARTEDGFVFRVDMRLRPFGDSGPLVASFASLEDYLQLHGRDWERYAYVKARALTHQGVYAPLREQVMRPFVYRRYLDFGVFDALREMKGLISREVERRDLANHVKLGPGGIREIEFIVQAFQLIRGGQDRSLRETSLLAVLPRLKGDKLLPAAAVEELTRAYLFLRRLENRLQMLGDEQTHSLPVDALTAERIAYAMDLPDAASLVAALDVHRALVTRQFEAVVVAPAGEQARASVDLASLWEPGVDRNPLRGRLAALGMAQPDEVLRLLDDLRESARMRRLDEIGRRRLESLLKCLLCELPPEDAVPVLRRLLSIIEAIGQRSAYFALLLENTAARKRLIEVCAHGNFLASRIAEHPLLLDELIDDRVLDVLPDRPALAADLALRSAEWSEEEPDRQVEGLCRFQRAAIFRVALADLSDRLPLMQVSDRLTEIAELIIDEAMRLAWLQITATLGVPYCVEIPGAAPRPVQVAAIGYGKLGGRELGYSSDLDLVFVHDSVGEQQETDRATPVDNQVFFLRFAQRLMHILTVHSAAGRLYEVDVRLRPSGKGGLLVSSIDAFRDYQYQDAWTWEHQALLHARAVAGPSGLRARLEALRMEVLEHAVRREDLRQQVRDMRERMRRELSAGGEGRFDLKQDRGGIADIEFLAQYWALRWAQQYPPVAMFSDTIRQLESVASAALVPQEIVDTLVAAYQAYRTAGHHRSLDGLDNVLPAGAFAAERRAVAAIWEATMQDGQGL
jgi:glutamate-ammonia-ligase adenylyltransferase